MSAGTPMSKHTPGPLQRTKIGRTEIIHARRLGEPLTLCGRNKNRGAFGFVSHPSQVDCLTCRAAIAKIDETEAKP